MILNVIIDDTTHKCEVPPYFLQEGEDFFIKMDRDMDKGWQMSRTWTDNPDKANRCQIVADRLLTAIETENQKLAVLMAGYILSRMPGVTAVDIDLTGDMTATQFIMDTPTGVADIQEAQAKVTQKPIKTKMDAIEQAGKDITKVYKVGRAYRFATYDHKTERWLESPLVKAQQEANELRMKAYEERLAELIREIE